MYRVILEPFPGHRGFQFYRTEGREKIGNNLPHFSFSSLITYHHIVNVIQLDDTDNMEWDLAVFLESLGNRVTFSPPVTSVYCHSLKLPAKGPWKCHCPHASTLGPAVLLGALCSFTSRTSLVDIQSGFIFRHLIRSCQPWIWAWWKLLLVLKM